MTDAELDEIGRRIWRRAAIEHGIPDEITNPDVLNRIADILRDADRCAANGDHP